MPVEECRYRCGLPVTHYCDECASGFTGLSGYYCADHARRHDEIVLEHFRMLGVNPAGNAKLARPIGTERSTA